MSRYVSQETRKKVANRASYRCEYCLLPEFVGLFTFQIEHIISLQHGGKSVLTNLALACPQCNINKGTNLGTFLKDEEILVRFYHPRKDVWSDHFVFNKASIHAISKIGESTLKILRFNSSERIAERRALMDAGLYDDFL